MYVTSIFGSLENVKLIKHQQELNPIRYPGKKKKQKCVTINKNTKEFKNKIKDITKEFFKIHVGVHK